MNQGPLFQDCHANMARWDMAPAAPRGKLFMPLVPIGRALA
jgi:hypothetical protein